HLRSGLLQGIPDRRGQARIPLDPSRRMDRERGPMGFGRRGRVPSGPSASRSHLRLVLRTARRRAGAEGGVMAQDSPSRHLDQYPIRLPDGMRDEIKATAKANQRSMNAEIVARLEAGGETLRDRFAMAALTGAIANPE